MLYNYRYNYILILIHYVIEIETLMTESAKEYITRLSCFGHCYIAKHNMKVYSICYIVRFTLRCTILYYGYHVITFRTSFSSVIFLSNWNVQSQPSVEIFLKMYFCTQFQYGIVDLAIKQQSFAFHTPIPIPPPRTHLPNRCLFKRNICQLLI